MGGQFYLFISPARGFNPSVSYSVHILTLLFSPNLKSASKTFLSKTLFVVHSPQAKSLSFFLENNGWPFLGVQHQKKRILSNYDIKVLCMIYVGLSLLHFYEFIILNPFNLLQTNFSFRMSFSTYHLKNSKHCQI